MGGLAPRVPGIANSGLGKNYPRYRKRYLKTYQQKCCRHGKIFLKDGVNDSSMAMNSSSSTLTMSYQSPGDD